MGILHSALCIQHGRNRRLLVACGLALTICHPGCSGLEGLFEKKSPKQETAFPDDEPGPDEIEEPGVYRGTRERRYVAKVLDEGATLVLDDGSVWRVDPNDLIYSVAWASHQSIVVHDIHAAPRYKVVNASKREQVMAAYLGTPRAL